MPAWALTSSAASRISWSPSAAPEANTARSTWRNNWQNVCATETAWKLWSATSSWRKWASESAVMKAMILAAGLGTRLRPLTDTRAKALVELSGRTLLEITLTRLRTFGITEVIINVHHFADQVISYLKSHNNFGLRIEISREEILLDTGGGLKKAAWFFQENSGNDAEAFFLHNVDVLSSIDLALMLQSHKESDSLVTVAVQKRESSRQLLFDEAG